MVERHFSAAIPRPLPESSKAGEGSKRVNSWLLSRALPPLFLSLVLFENWNPFNCLRRWSYFFSWPTSKMLVYELQPAELSRNEIHGNFVIFLKWTLNFNRVCKDTRCSRYRCLWVDLLCQAEKGFGFSCWSLLRGRPKVGFLNQQKLFGLFYFCGLCCRNGADKKMALFGEGVVKDETWNYYP